MSFDTLVALLQYLVDWFQTLVTGAIAWLESVLGSAEEGSSLLDAAVEEVSSAVDELL